jgi:hypothetical protein
MTMGSDAEFDQLGMEVEVRRIQPYEANKIYLCPGCNQDIPRGTGHIVAVPIEAADLRRHWHRGCWTNRVRRRPGRG